MSMPWEIFDGLFLSPTSGWLPKAVDVEGFPPWAGCHSEPYNEGANGRENEGNSTTFCGFRFAVWGRMLFANICPASSVGSQLALKLKFVRANNNKNMFLVQGNQGRKWQWEGKTLPLLKNTSIHLPLCCLPRLPFFFPFSLLICDSPSWAIKKKERYCYHGGSWWGWKKVQACLTKTCVWGGLYCNVRLIDSYFCHLWYSPGLITVLAAPCFIFLPAYFIDTSFLLLNKGWDGNQLLGGLIMYVVRWSLNGPFS